MIDWRKRFPRPEDSVWCDECLRWEIGDGRFERPAVPASARVLYALSRAARWPGNRVADLLTDAADTIQVQANVKNGVFHARRP